MVTIQRFIAGLSEIPEGRFTHAGVLEYLRANPVNLPSLSSYLYFSGEHYARWMGSSGSTSAGLEASMMTCVVGSIPQ